MSLDRDNELTAALVRIDLEISQTEARLLEPLSEVEMHQVMHLIAALQEQRKIIEDNLQGDEKVGD